VRKLISCALGAIAWIISPKTAVLLGEPLFYLLGMRKSAAGMSLRSVKNVLIVKLDEIGDTVLAIPFIKELRNNVPGARITLVVKPQVLNLMELCPYVDEVIAFDWNTSGVFGEYRRHWRALCLAISKLWSRRFDLAIIPRWDSDHYHASFVSYFSGARWRVGYSEKVIEHKRIANKGYDVLLTHAIEKSGSSHEIEHNLDILRFLGGSVRVPSLELWLSNEDEVFASKLLADYGIKDGDFLLGICPTGGSSVLKQWPMSNFIGLSAWAIEEYNAKIIIIGGPNDKPLSEEIAEKLGKKAVNACGETTLRQMAALIKKCRVFVSNDTGPMHIAAAVGIPVIALFGSSCPHRFGPVSESSFIIQKEMDCNPCHGSIHKDRCSSCIYKKPECMVEISVNEVIRAVTELSAISE